MTYQIAPDSPKARHAIAFGLELAKACAVRDVPLKEVGRQVGAGHTTLWHYRFGHTLPKLATAAALAVALDWPKLRELVVTARTRQCARTGCAKAFINDIGSEARKYCSPACGHIAANIRQAETRARSAGQTGSNQAKRAHVQRLRAAVRIADGRVGLMSTAIEAMCRECEPEGLCRTADCPLRLFSPLPLGDDVGVPRTLTAIRAATVQGPAARAKRSAAMKVVHADPAYKARHSASLKAALGKRTPEQRAATVAKAKASYPAARRAETSRRVHAKRREGRPNAA